MIVDKSAEIRSSIKKIIKSNINENITIEASNYDDAFFHLYSVTPDYIIMDIESLNGNGLMFLKSSIALLPENRVILFTNFASPEIKEKLFATGIKNIYSKTSETESFVQALMNIIENGRSMWNTENVIHHNY